MAEVLARVDLAWDEVVPPVDTDFVRYNVYRDGVLIAQVDTIATPYYSDYLAIPGQHIYEASWTGDVSGALIESERASVQASLTFPGAWLHDAGDPDHALRVLAARLAPSWEQGIEYRRAGGSAAPTAFVSRALASRWRVDLIPEQIGDPTTHDTLLDLLRRQFEAGAVLCLRIGFRDGARYFVQAERPASDWAGGLERIAFEAQEVSYSETPS